MKKLRISVLVALLLSLTACEADQEIKKPVLPDVGYIKAKVNGKLEIFTTVSPQEGDNYIRPGAINLVFRENENSTKYWGLNISHSYAALDLHDLPLPFTITGPGFDFSGKSPEAHVAIGDNQVGFYGHVYAQGSTFEHEFTVILTSVEGNIVRGTFHGKGFGIFREGEFAAELPVENW